MRARWARLRYLIEVLGPIGAARRVAAKLLSPIYFAETLVVTNSYYLSEPPDDREYGPGAFNSEVVTSIAELEARRDQMHPDLDYDYMIDFLRNGSERAYVSLYTHEAPNGKTTYIGMGSDDVGWFEMPEYRLGGPLGDHVLVGYEWEIVPEFRGRGLSYKGRYASVKHRQTLGVTMSTGVVRSHNLPSLKSSVRQLPGNRATINGVFRVSRWFGGRWVRTPPWEEIRALMESPPGSTSLPAGMGG